MVRVIRIWKMSLQIIIDNSHVILVVAACVLLGGSWLLGEGPLSTALYVLGLASCLGAVYVYYTTGYFKKKDR
jgi:hypothetical protein